MHYLKTVSESVIHLGGKYFVQHTHGSYYNFVTTVGSVCTEAETFVATLSWW